MVEIEDEIETVELHVDILERGEKPRAGHIACRLQEDIEFSSRKLETYCLSNWEPLVFDALLVTATIEFCDHVRRRPALGWTRVISVRIPVHDPERWNNSATRTSLIEAVELVTGDRWDINFRARKRKESQRPQTKLPMPGGVEAVIPFSNGLDSFAVAGLLRQQMGNRLLRVRVGDTGGRDKLTKGREPFASIPYRVRHRRVRSVETSARSRGFKFGIVSGLAAYLVQAQTIVVPESGQGALGPTLVPVGHAYEDYRNHPLFARRMETFLSHLFGNKVQFIFPRLWHTKGETLQHFLSAGGDARALLTTRSCWQDRRKVSIDHKMRQCGICAACMLRRVSLHAAGLVDSAGSYVWEDLSKPTFELATPSGVRPGNAQRQYALAGTLHMDHLANLLHSQADTAPLKSRSEQLGAAVGLNATEALGRLKRLLRTHESEWAAFLNDLEPNSFVKKWTAKPHERAA